MKFPLDWRRAVLLVSACVLLQQGGIVRAAGKPAAQSNVAAASSPASSSPDESDDADDHVDAQGTAQGTAQGDVAGLLQLIHDGGLAELRTTYNGGYGASLFFHVSDMTYYVALFQDKHFWRVIKTSDEHRAESIYAGFARQTAQLADVEIRRTQLQAQKASIERVIGVSEDRARRLQADLDVARAQQAKVADYQRQTQDETVALREEKEKAQMQLRQLQQQVLQLQHQAEAGLPASR